MTPSSGGWATIVFTSAAPAQLGLGGPGEPSTSGEGVPELGLQGGVRSCPTQAACGAMDWGPTGGSKALGVGRLLLQLFSTPLQ